jgi:hypothetical protein
VVYDFRRKRPDDEASRGIHGENSVGRNKNFVQRNFCCVGRFEKILQRFEFFVGVFGE